jgi:hypothetical protein
MADPKDKKVEEKPEVETKKELDDKELEKASGGWRR